MTNGDGRIDVNLSTIQPRITASGAEVAALIGCDNFNERTITIDCQAGVMMKNGGNLKLAGEEFNGGKGSQLVLKAVH